jgi:hypothetical protein
LTANTTYHYRVRSTDASGNSAVSSEHTFTTGKQACTNRSLVSSYLSPKSVSKYGSYTITCDYGIVTNGINAVVGSGSCAFSSWAGTSARFNCTAGNISGAFNNSCSLSNTAPDNYCSRNDAISKLTVIASVAPADKNPPIISAVSTSNLTSDSVTVTWRTSEPASSQVEYGPSLAYGTKTQLENELVSQHSVVLRSLSAATPYHFRVRSKDQVSNEAVSINNLAAQDITQNSVTLYWAAPGDDGSEGQALSYDIRYSQSKITDENWDSATAVSISVTPIKAGLTQSVTINGLFQGFTYYFAIKATDDAGNVSDLSNVAQGTIKSVIDLKSIINYEINIGGYDINVLVIIGSVLVLILAVWLVRELRKKSKYF